MLKTLQSAVDAAAFAATDGTVEALPLSMAPYGKGDIALCISPLIKALRQPPQVAGKSITDSITALPYVTSASLAGVYINIRLDINVLAQAATQAIGQPDIKVAEPQRVMVEYLSPNTNKPLHLGHIRNGVLGSTVANLLSAVGHTVIRAELINDRGEHICKSMLGYMRHGNGATPESSGKKGDRLVGDMYVAYSKDDEERRNALAIEANRELEPLIARNEKVRAAVREWNESKGKDDKARKAALKALLKLVPETEVRSRELVTGVDGPDPDLTALLKQWEDGDPEVLALWKTMNGWVYDGFAVTKPRFGFHFDKVYYESGIYTLGKDRVQEGLRRGVFFTDTTGAVLFDLPVGKYGTNQDGKAHRKKLLNPNGTSGYLTQDIGTAILKANEFNLDRSIYVVANEQDSHFMALFGILDALGYTWAQKCYHMSYAMVDHKGGKMKSRKGTVVDGDDLADEMAALAADIIRSRDGVLDEAEIARRAEVIGITAIKFYLARYSPTSKINYVPETSISFDGDTGPYCLYTYARAQSVIAKAQRQGASLDGVDAFTRLGNDDERACLLEVLGFAEGVRKAAEHCAPSILTDRMLALCAAFNRFYKNNQVISEDGQLTRERLALVKMTSEALRWGFSLFGIEPLENM